MAGVARRRLEPGSAVERDAARLLGLASVHRGRRERTLRGIWERGGEDGSRFEGCDVVWAVVTSKDYAPLAAAKVLVCAEGHWVDEMVAVDGEVGRAAAVMALLSAHVLRPWGSHCRCFQVMRRAWWKFVRTCAA